MYQSMPGPSRFEGYEGLSGPPTGPISHLKSPFGGESCLPLASPAVHGHGEQAALPLCIWRHVCCSLFAVIPFTVILFKKKKIENILRFPAHVS